jgi:hypothetical protein
MNERLEYWSGGVLEYWVFPAHHSSIPLLHHSKFSLRSFHA